MTSLVVHKHTVRIALVLAFFVIVLGAYTRLVDAGLGCPDWPGCYGFLILPVSDSEISEANQRFSDQPFEMSKAVPEVVHRVVAGTLGMLILLIFVLSWHTRKRLTLPLIMLVLVSFQAALGAWTVTLKLWPQVVTAHLLGGFATLALLFLYAYREGLLPSRRIQVQKSWVPILFLVLVVCQIVLGGWTSANYAALACPDFPLCHGQLLPEADFKEGFNILQDVGPNYLGGNMSSEARVAIQLVHRFGAVVVLIAGIWLLVELPRNARIHVGTLLVCQLVLGILNVVLNLPLYIAVLHNLGGALLMLSALQIVVSSATFEENTEREPFSA